MTGDDADAARRDDDIPTREDAPDGPRGDDLDASRVDDGGPAPPGPGSFALFENPRSESVAYHVSDHWREVRVARVGDPAAETQTLLLTCDRCEVRYWLEDVPAERVPGTRKFEELRS